MKYSFRYLLSRKLRKFGLLPDAKDSEAVKNMLKAIKNLEGGKIKFEFEFDENGNWAVESLNVNGIVTGGTFDDNIPELINDAIFTYYAIPPEYCDDSLLLKKSKTKEAKTSSRFYVYESAPSFA